MLENAKAGDATRSNATLAGENAAAFDIRSNEASVYLKTFIDQLFISPQKKKLSLQTVETVQILDSRSRSRLHTLAVYGSARALLFQKIFCSSFW
jgi:hypothetical protein